MADLKISALTASTTPLAGTEVLPIVQSSTTKQVSVANLTAGRAVGATSIQFGSGSVLSAYEEGTWTPVLTFATPGDLSVTYTTQAGTYTKIGNKVFINFFVVTSSFTYTTSAGGLRITGLPFTSKNLTGDEGCGTLAFSGITQVGYTQFTSRIAPNVSYIAFLSSSSGLAVVAIAVANATSGSTINLRGNFAYDV
jgi:hypothetical protein